MTQAAGFAPLSNWPSTDLDPLVLTSPTPRCGTTLLQRLLCSSQSALIYGEKCAQDLELLLNICIFKTQEYHCGRAAYEQELQKVLHGEVNHWLLELMPDIDGYLSVLQKSALAGIAYCREYAIRSGRPVWGMKYPGWSPITLRLISNVMPGARFIFILRNLADCVKSAKAQRMIYTKEEVHQFCQKWLEGVTYANGMCSNDAALVLHYEDLVAQPEETLAQLASFSGLHDLDRSVLEHKINVWMGQQFSTQSRDGYIPPAELSEAEAAIVAEAMAQFKQAISIS